MDTLCYQGLNDARQEIRLLTISPADSFTDQLICELVTVPLATTLRFTALSYVWGNPSVRENILVNEQVFAATKNLCTALRYIRKHFASNNLPNNTPRSLWVDAVCINQHNTQERNVQVCLMNKLFASAHSVISYLGSGDSASNSLAMHTIKSLGSKQELATLFSVPRSALASQSSVGSSVQQGLCNRQKTGTPSPGLLEDHENLALHMEAFHSFVDLPYWSRVWIIQELALARPTSNILMYEDTWITFQDVRNFLAFIEKSHESLLNPVSAAVTNNERELQIYTAQYFRSISARFAFSETVRIAAAPWVPPESFLIFPLLTFSFGQTDDRDAVYGLLGLVPDGLLEVDYSKSVEEVYVDWFCRLLERMPDYNRLSRVWSCFQRSSSPDLPSWVPDLRQKQCKCIRDHLPASHPDNWWYTDHTPDLKIDNGKILRIPLACIDKVTQVTHVNGGAPSLKRYCLDFLRCHSDRHHKSGLTPLVALFKTLRNGDGPRRTPHGKDPARDILSELNAPFRTLITTPFIFSTPINKLLDPVERAAIVFHFIASLIWSSGDNDEVDDEACRLLGLGSDGRFPGSAESYVNQFFPNQDIPSILEDFPGSSPGMPCWADTNLDYVFARIRNNTVELSPSLVQESSFDFAMFETSTGYLGKGRPGVATGDYVYVPARGDTLFVIRQDSHFSLVGPCYIAGLSDGEAAEMVVAGDFLVEEIPLS